MSVALFCDAARCHGHPTDCDAIAGLYHGLVALHPTAGALTGFAMARDGNADPVCGLTILQTADAPRAAAYQPLRAVRAQRGQAVPLGRAGSGPRIVPSASSTCQALRPAHRKSNCEKP